MPMPFKILGNSVYSYSNVDAITQRSSLTKTAQSEISKPRTRSVGIGLPKTKSRIQKIKPGTIKQTLVGLTKLLG